MIFKEKNPEYSTKLDGYYFDKKINSTMIVLKVRNKRATSTVPVKKILNNKDALSTLHPIDLCIIGILSNEQITQSDKYHFKTVPDNLIFPRKTGHQLYAAHSKPCGV